MSISQLKEAKWNITTRPGRSLALDPYNPYMITNLPSVSIQSWQSRLTPFRSNRAGSSISMANNQISRKESNSRSKLFDTGAPKTFSMDNSMDFGYPAIFWPSAPHRSKAEPPGPKRSPTLTSILDWFANTKISRKSARTNNERSRKVTTTEAPPLVYIPDGGQRECEDYQDTRFDTYSFIGFLLGVVNIVAQVGNNVNNNLNNNNNNDNNNNNNLENINVANSNSAQNNQNNVNIPAGMENELQRHLGHVDDSLFHPPTGLFAEYNVYYLRQSLCLLKGNNQASDFFFQSVSYAYESK
ncbi:hypothetical protein SK128_020753 [Halocaridina rubra]|uniref:Uncharacterized protein n=1 Tax=Halocaridina rubra TaxID=373956 RepID=A0AAN8WTY5_HALRR